MYVLAHALAPVVPLLLVRWRWPRASLSRIPPLWLAIGGLLPDVVDKPLGHLVLGYGHGRLWMHTLLATLALAAVAIALWRASPRFGPVGAALALGVASHVVLDAMWGSPAIFLWPLLGPMPHRAYDPMLYLTVVTHPHVLLTEGAAAVALLAALVGTRARRLVGRRRARAAER